MAETCSGTPRYQTTDEAEESFLALVRALRAIQPNGAAKSRPAREHGRHQAAHTIPTPPVAGTSRP